MRSTVCLEKHWVTHATGGEGGGLGKAPLQKLGKASAFLANPGIGLEKSIPQSSNGLGKVHV